MKIATTRRHFFEEARTGDRHELHGGREHGAAPLGASRASSMGLFPCCEAGKVSPYPSSRPLSQATCQSLLCGLAGPTLGQGTPQPGFPARAPPILDLETCQCPLARFDWFDWVSTLWEHSERQENDSGDSVPVHEQVSGWRHRRLQPASELEVVRTCCGC